MAVDRLIKNWPAIKMYFINQGQEECDHIIWKCIQDVDGLSDLKTLPELILYFVHSFL